MAYKDTFAASHLIQKGQTQHTCHSMIKPHQCSVRVVTLKKISSDKFKRCAKYTALHVTHIRSLTTYG